ncbi:MAG: hypothetical protein ACK4IX_05965 [Candidatus Sericytochromatia bacterium]
MAENILPPSLRDDIAQSLRASFKNDVSEDIIELAADASVSYDDFTRSTYHDNLNETETEYAQMIIMDFSAILFVNNRYDKEWDESVIDLFLEILPKYKVGERKAYYESISGVLSNYFKFLGEDGILSDDEDMSKRAETLYDMFVELAPENDEIENSQIEDNSDQIIEEAEELFLEFSESRKFNNLTEEQKENAESIIINFTEFMFRFHNVVIEEWTNANLTACCLETLPNKLPAKEDWFKAFVPVMVNYFEFLKDAGMFFDVSSIVNTLKESESQIISRSQNHTLWDADKKILMMAILAGVDINSSEKIAEFIREKMKELENSVEE